MKKIIPFIAVLALAACGEGEKSNPDLDRLTAKRDSLVTALDEINVEIAAMDTTKVLLPLVEVIPVKKQKFEHFFEAQGNVQSESSAVLYAEAGGNVSRILVKEGQAVKAGQTLVTFDTKVVGANIKELEVRLALAKTAYERQKNLWDQKIGSEMQLLQAESQMKSLEQSIATLKAQKSMGVISAPFSGTIDQIMPKKGEMVPPGMPVLRLVNLDKVYVEADIPETYLNKIKVGDPVLLNFGAGGESNIPSTIADVGRYVNPANRTIRIKAEVDQSVQLYPNMIAKVKVRDFVSAAPVIKVPSKYILDKRGGEGRYVKVVREKDGKKVIDLVAVEAGMEYHAIGEKMSWTHILSSELIEGDLIVGEGFKKVREKQEVITTPAE